MDNCILVSEKLVMTEHFGQEKVFTLVGNCYCRHPTLQLVGCDLSASLCEPQVFGEIVVKFDDVRAEHVTIVFLLTFSFNSFRCC